jgi:8-oxo-dGTP diphosphatase
MDSKPLALSVRILLFNPEGQVLLLLRSKRSKTNPGRWELPGGKIDPGESFDTALNREIMEETGLTVQIHHAAGTAEQDVAGWHVIHLVLTGTIQSGMARISDEHEEFCWVGIDEMNTMDLADWFSEYYTTSLSLNRVDWRTLYGK